MSISVKDYVLLQRKVNKEILNLNSLLEAIVLTPAKRGREQEYERLKELLPRLEKARVELESAPYMVRLVEPGTNKEEHG